MIIVMLITLFSSRILLQNLGVDDFGIYNVVGGVVAMLTFFNSTLSATCQRYFSADIGIGDRDKLINDFKVIFSLYLFFVIIVLIIGETIGLWFVENKMNISDDRIIAVRYVYQFSLATFVVSSISVPYNALVISFEKMSVFAYISIFECLLKFISAIIIPLFLTDDLIIYSLLIFLSSGIVTLIYYLYTKHYYNYIKIRLVYKISVIKEIAAYSGWHLLGGLSVLVRNQGVNVLLNLFFPPVVNAARAISYQIMNAADSLTSNFFTAVKPQIYKLYAANDLEKGHRLVNYSSIVCCYLVSIIAFPVLFNVEYVIGLWLGNIPQYTIFFTQLVLINAIIESINGPSIAAALASGRIKLFEIVTGLIMLANLPLSYIFLRLGYSPYVTMYISILLSVITIFVRAKIVETLVGLSFKYYVKDVVLKLFFVCLLAPIVPYLLCAVFEGGFLRLLFTTVTSIIMLSVLTFYFCLRESERVAIIAKISEKVTSKFKK